MHENLNEFLYLSSSSSCADSTDSSDTLTIHPYQSFLLAGLLDGIQYPHRADQPTLVYLWVRVHRRISLMSSSRLLQQCQECLVCITWVAYEIEGRWLYSCCFTRCYFHDTRNPAATFLYFFFQVFFWQAKFQTTRSHEFTHTPSLLRTLLQEKLAHLPKRYLDIIL